MDSVRQIESLKAAIRDVRDFPKAGVVFKDLTTLLNDASTFRMALDLLVDACRGRKAERIVAIESRGFIWGSALADRLGLAFVPVRKPGKLPWKTLSARYELEYGSDELQIHADALRPGESVLVVDDLIATGGTAQAAGELVRGLGGTVAAYVFLVELSFLGGRAKLPGVDVISLLRYE
jgi:adenine phosphoribosyltransferase